MSVHDLSTVGIPSIKEKQTLLDLSWPCGKTKDKKQVMAIKSHAEVTSLLISANCQVSLKIILPEINSAKCILENAPMLEMLLCVTL